MESDGTQHEKKSQRVSNFAKLIVPKSVVQDIQTVFRNAKFFPFRASDDKMIVSVPRNESEMLMQLLTDMNVPVELQDYKSPYLQYLMPREYENKVNDARLEVKQWRASEDPDMNVVSVHYRLNPQLWEFCKKNGIRLERIRKANE